jgi:hypothetical protein
MTTPHVVAAAVDLDDQQEHRHLFAFTFERAARAEYLLDQVRWGVGARIASDLGHDRGRQLEPARGAELDR